MPNDRSRCLSCRALHAKCTIDPGQRVCSRCRTLGKSQCIFETTRFKSCKSTTIAAQRTDFIYRPSQPWVPTDLKLAFVSETGDGLENIVQATEDESISSSDQEVCTSDRFPNPHSHRDTAPNETTESVNTTSESTWAEPLHTAIELLNRQQDRPPQIHDSPEQIMSATPASSSTISSLPTTLEAEISPAGTSITSFETQGSRSHTFGSTDITTSPMRPLTHREAILIHYFISVVSPWVRQSLTVLRMSNNQLMPVSA